jgi:ABC-type amino acid transport substrate-binding protein
LGVSKHLWAVILFKSLWKSQFFSRIVFSLLCVLAMALLWHPPKPDLAWQAVQSTRQLVFAVDATFPPFAYLDSQAQYAGFDIELARLLARELGVEAVFHLYAYDGLVGTLTAGRSQAVISAQTALPNRLHEVRYTQAYINVGTLLLCPTRTCPADNARLPNWAVGQHLGVELGSQGDVLARRWQKLAEPVARTSYDSNALAVQALLAGEVTATLSEAIQGWQFIAEHPDYQALPAENVPYVVLVGADSDKLLQALSQALRRLEESGELPALRAKWFGAVAQTITFYPFAAQDEKELLNKP